MKTLKTGLAMGVGVGVLGQIPGTEGVTAGLGKGAKLLPVMMGVEVMQSMTPKQKKKNKW